MYEIKFFDLIDSTNEYLMQLARSGERGKLCAVARSQTKGRGRRGRSFSSPKNGLYMSLLLCDIPMDRAMLLTPTVGCAVARAIENIFGISVGIKWVNDLFFGGKKVCGILCETKFDFDKRLLDYAVVGIGINLTPPEGGFDEDIKDIAAALRESITEEQYHALIDEILLQIEESLPKLGSAELIEEYKSRSVILNKEISVHTPQGEYKAVAVDIDSMGNLVVEAGGKREILSSGEISVRF